MIRVGITDPDGFLGQHLRWFLLPLKETIECSAISISDLQSGAPIPRCDVIVHLASAHQRNTEREENIPSANLSFAQALTGACETLGVFPHMIFASSTQVRSESIYGKSKKEVEKYLRDWTSAHEATMTNLIIPNEFGEGGQPFDTSFISTFCHQLARGEKSDVSDANVSLIHGQEVARAIHRLIMTPVDGDVELPGVYFAVADVYTKLHEYYECYASDVVPKLQDPLHTALFNTLRYHLWENGFYPRSLELKSDDRGVLFDVVRERTGGQTFISTTKPGQTRGEHYHTRKIERFCVVHGKATIRLRPILGTNIQSFDVRGEEPVFIDMPTFVAHNITNTGNTELTTAFWCNEILDLKDTDTYHLPV